MGWGDEIMATAQARRLQLKDPRPVAVLDRFGGPRWHSIWEGNPRMARPGYAAVRGVQHVRNAPGMRPYLDYARFNNRDKTQPYVYTDFRVEPGEIYLNEAEKALGERFAGDVIIEPHIKPSASPNKQWGWQRWQRLVPLLRELMLEHAPGARLLQLGPYGTPTLGGVELVDTGMVREAAAVLSRAALFVGPEGGLHHAAAALGVRAVVIFGGFISPRTTGYALHTNLYFGELDRACGMRMPCSHCAAAMERITPELVADSALAQLQGLAEHRSCSA